MIRYLRLLLFPVSLLYGVVVMVRNLLYDKGILKTEKFDIPVICVGNLAVGGSGKTPVTEYLVQLLQGKRIAILSRGYGRSTRGFILAGPADTAETIGDEPKQFSSKFPGVTVAVCENRAEGIRRLKDNHDLIILDDAFQHRSVTPGFSILLFEYDKLRTPQFLLPAGNLREPFHGHRRAQLCLVTKAPEQPTNQQIASATAAFSSPEQVLFSFLRYGDLVHLHTGETKPLQDIQPATEVFLLSGIANPAPLCRKLAAYTTRLRHFEHPDHYAFKAADIGRLTAAFMSSTATDKLIVTTEKDMQRLQTGTLRELLLNLPIYYLPVKVAMQPQASAIFDQKITDYVAGTTRNR